ncbi:hypothetical protein JQX13_30395 [Archangium violaceum]|uniref:hypothetical protein n=1 Tax=Archangium violaceum TaxID=83451 RepID=UPI00193BFFBC|nr:hypothetical protein [Archangium violaceum]QRK04550.1 hypothetical protein JQX13_30395 [Archangium violaceum]
MRHSRFHSFAALAGSLVTTAAFACPDCTTAQVVRASVLGEDFWSLLVTMTVPFLLIGSLSALLYRVGLPPRDAVAARDRNEPGAET